MVAKPWYLFCAALPTGASIVAVGIGLCSCWCMFFSLTAPIGDIMRCTAIDDALYYRSPEGCANPYLLHHHESVTRRNLNRGIDGCVYALLFWLVGGFPGNHEFTLRKSQCSLDVWLPDTSVLTSG